MATVKMMASKISIILLAVLMLTVKESAGTERIGFWEGGYRGVNATNLTEDDIQEVSKWGANVIRLSFNKMPLMKKNPPYGIDDESFAYLDKVMSWAEKYNIKIIIDPHTVPGTKGNTTTSPKDELWYSEEYQRRLIELWSYISKRYATTGDVIAGYDLLNEPNVPRDAAGHPLGGVSDWNNLVEKLIKTIRSNDKFRIIIVEPIASQRIGRNRIYPLDGTNYLILPTDRNVVLSPHFYEPEEFSHQQVTKWWPEVAQYPGYINGRYWDKNQLRKVLQPIRDFQIATGVPIFIGEFSAPRWTGQSGNSYLRDAIEIFEEYKWSWAYHVFRGASEWDAEQSNEKKDMNTGRGPTDRTRLLREFFKKNIMAK